MASLPAVRSQAEVASQRGEPPAGAVLVFFAPWHEPSVQLVTVATEAARDHPNLRLLSVDAEASADLSQAFGVRSVPTCVFLAPGSDQVVAKLEGANAPAFVTAVAAHSQRVALPSLPAAPRGGAAAPAAEDVGGAALNARLSDLVRSSPVMVFIKGTPDAPRCGFSRQLVEILRGEGCQFGFFDILTDEAVRQGLKTFSNWPTYPQVYVDGKLVGGLDVIKELQADNELKTALTPAAPAMTPLHERLAALTNQGVFMLFMKGVPDEPRCGFSRKIVELLRAQNVPFSSFNILEDEEVRQGLKEFSNWPTYPQLYHHGKLLGGLDVVTELAADGELAELVEADKRTGCDQ